MSYIFFPSTLQFSFDVCKCIYDITLNNDICSWVLSSTNTGSIYFCKKAFNNSALVVSGLQFYTSYERRKLKQSDSNSLIAQFGLGELKRHFSKIVKEDESKYCNKTKSIAKIYRILKYIENMSNRLDMMLYVYSCSSLVCIWFSELILVYDAFICFCSSSIWIIWCSIFLSFSQYVCLTLIRLDMTLLFS